ncbi:MAG: 3-isopropylmalate dehydrogenase [Patescibacteria group bacterium]|nr:3-isopropylmalate dehydrogenase [Patescibacteria group bacterium]MBU1876804.1 3-isopropylmalate dehydrogenase [Patescibacteria group bacterium]
MKTGKIAVLAGDGIGPEVMAEGLKVLTTVEERFNFNLLKQSALIGGAAYDKKGHPFPDETKEICDNSDAILFSSVGGPKWSNLPPELTPERGALLPLRKRYNLFVNLRPIVVYPGLEQASSLKQELIKDLNLLVVRELTGGIYFSDPKWKKKNEAIDTMAYSRTEIERIAHFAFQAAKERRKILTSIDKANVLMCSKLWREVVTEVAQEYPDVECNHLYVDNAAMQLIRKPKQFDVILCGNMFGDILSDEASQLTGSLGMLPSASINAETSFGMYEPAGGSAPDIAGKGIANPLAQILSCALMLRYTFKLEKAATAIEQAVQQVIADNIRTIDIISDGCRQVSTSEMGDEIVKILVR